jgi:3-isopropylmalate dehydratase small subunit
LILIKYFGIIILSDNHTLAGVLRMKVYQNAATEILTNQEDNEEISFEISSNDEVIIDMLRRNYAHPIQTPVQEYLCNARDACRESNNPESKIEVSLPNILDATLKIRDYGVGLSPERVRSVFTKYGESTKRQ